MFKIDYIQGSCSNLAEGCIYNPSEDSLYWVDIDDSKIFRYYLKNKSLKQFQFNKKITSLAFYNHKKIIATTQDGFEYIDLESLTIEPIIDPEYNQPNNRFNDGKCDKYGRYFAGTMNNSEEQITGSLYCFDGKNLQKKEQNLSISNGLGWNNNASKFYLTDSLKGIIYQYDYEIKSAKLSNRKIFTKVDKKDGYPDGLTIDNENCIWSAHWDGSKITRYFPSGKVSFVIDMPVPRVTCCCFGGHDYSTLFVTTAKSGLNKKQLKKAPLSGNIFILKTNVTGQKSNFFKKRK